MARVRGRGDGSGERVKIRVVPSKLSQAFIIRPTDICTHMHTNMLTYVRACKHTSRIHIYPYAHMHSQSAAAHEHKDGHKCEHSSCCNHDHKDNSSCCNHDHKDNKCVAVAELV